MRIRISEISRITRPFDIKEDQDVKGVVRLNFRSQPPFSPLFPSMVKAQTCKVPFFSEGPSCPLAFDSVFILDGVLVLILLSYHQKATSYQIFFVAERRLDGRASSFFVEKMGGLHEELFTLC